MWSHMFSFDWWCLWLQIPNSLVYQMKDHLESPMPSSVHQPRNRAKSHSQRVQHSSEKEQVGSAIVGSLCWVLHCEMYKFKIACWYCPSVVCLKYDWLPSWKMLFYCLWEFAKCVRFIYLLHTFIHVQQRFFSLCAPSLICPEFCNPSILPKAT